MLDFSEEGSLNSLPLSDVERIILAVDDIDDASSCGTYWECWDTEWWNQQPAGSDIIGSPGGDSQPGFQTPRTGFHTPGSGVSSASSAESLQDYILHGRLILKRSAVVGYECCGFIILRELQSKANDIHATFVDFVICQETMGPLDSSPTCADFDSHTCLQTLFYEVHASSPSLSRVTSPGLQDTDRAHAPTQSGDYCTTSPKPRSSSLSTRGSTRGGSGSMGGLQVVRASVSQEDLSNKRYVALTILKTPESPPSCAEEHSLYGGYELVIYETSSAYTGECESVFSRFAPHPIAAQFIYYKSAQNDVSFLFFSGNEQVESYRIKKNIAIHDARILSRVAWWYWDCYASKLYFVKESVSSDRNSLFVYAFPRNRRPEVDAEIELKGVGRGFRERNSVLPGSSGSKQRIIFLHMFGGERSVCFVKLSLRRNKEKEGGKGRRYVHVPSPSRSADGTAFSNPFDPLGSIPDTREHKVRVVIFNLPSRTRTEVTINIPSTGMSPRHRITASPIHGGCRVSQKPRHATSASSTLPPLSAVPPIMASSNSFHCSKSHSNSLQISPQSGTGQSPRSSGGHAQAVNHSSTAVPVPIVRQSNPNHSSISSTATSSSTNISSFPASGALSGAPSFRSSDERGHRRRGTHDTRATHDTHGTHDPMPARSPHVVTCPQATYSQDHYTESTCGLTTCAQLSGVVESTSQGVDVSERSRSESGTSGFYTCPRTDTPSMSVSAVGSYSISSAYTPSIIASDGPTASGVPSANNSGSLPDEDDRCLLSFEGKRHVPSERAAWTHSEKDGDEKDGDEKDGDEKDGDEKDGGADCVTEPVSLSGTPVLASEENVLARQFDESSAPKHDATGSPLGCLRVAGSIPRHEHGKQVLDSTVAEESVGGTASNLASTAACVSASARATSDEGFRIMRPNVLPSPSSAVASSNSLRALLPEDPHEPGILVETAPLCVPPSVPSSSRDSLMNNHSGGVPQRRPSPSILVTPPYHSYIPEYPHESTPLATALSSPARMEDPSPPHRVMLCQLAGYVVILIPGVALRLVDCTHGHRGEVCFTGDAVPRGPPLDTCGSFHVFPYSPTSHDWMIPLATASTENSLWRHPHRNQQLLLSTSGTVFRLSLNTLQLFRQMEAEMRRCAGIDTFGWASGCVPRLPVSTNSEPALPASPRSKNKNKNKNKPSDHAAGVQHGENTGCIVSEECGRQLASMVHLAVVHLDITGFVDKIMEVLPSIPGAIPVELLQELLLAVPYAALRRQQAFLPPVLSSAFSFSHLGSLRTLLREAAHTSDEADELFSQSATWACYGAVAAVTPSARALAYHSMSSAPLTSSESLLSASSSSDLKTPSSPRGTGFRIRRFVQGISDSLTAMLNRLRGDELEEDEPFWDPLVLHYYQPQPQAFDSIDAKLFYLRLANRCLNVMTSLSPATPRSEVSRLYTPRNENCVSKNSRKSGFSLSLRSPPLFSLPGTPRSPTLFSSMLQSASPSQPSTTAHGNTRAFGAANARANQQAPSPFSLSSAGVSSSSECMSSGSQAAAKAAVSTVLYTQTSHTNSSGSIYTPNTTSKSQSNPSSALGAGTHVFPEENVSGTTPPLPQPTEQHQTQSRHAVPPRPGSPKTVLKSLRQQAVAQHYQKQSNQTQPQKVVTQPYRQQQQQPPRVHQQQRYVHHHHQLQHHQHPHRHQSAPLPQPLQEQPLSYPPSLQGHPGRRPAPVRGVPTSERESNSKLTSLPGTSVFVAEQLFTLARLFSLVEWDSSELISSYDEHVPTITAHIPSSGTHVPLLRNPYLADAANDGSASEPAGHVFSQPRLQSTHSTTLHHMEPKHTLFTQTQFIETRLAQPHPALLQSQPQTQSQSQSQAHAAESESALSSSVPTYQHHGAFDRGELFSASCPDNMLLRPLLPGRDSFSKEGDVVGAEESTLCNTRYMGSGRFAQRSPLSRAPADLEPTQVGSTCNHSGVNELPVQSETHRAFVVGSLGGTESDPTGEFVARLQDGGASQKTPPMTLMAERCGGEANHPPPEPSAPESPLASVSSPKAEVSPEFVPSHVSAGDCPAPDDTGSTPSNAFSTPGPSFPASRAIEGTHESSTRPLEGLGSHVQVPAETIKRLDETTSLEVGKVSDHSRRRSSGGASGLHLALHHCTGDSDVDEEDDNLARGTRGTRDEQTRGSMSRQARGSQVTHEGHEPIDTPSTCGLDARAQWRRLFLESLLLAVESIGRRFPPLTPPLPDDFHDALGYYSTHTLPISVYLRWLQCGRLQIKPKFAERLQSLPTASCPSDWPLPCTVVSSSVLDTLGPLDDDYDDGFRGLQEWLGS